MPLVIQCVKFVTVLKRILTAKGFTNCAVHNTLGQINR